MHVHRSELKGKVCTGSNAATSRIEELGHSRRFPRMLTPGGQFPQQRSDLTSQWCAVCRHVTCLDILHDHVDVRGGLNDLVQPDDVRVHEKTQNLDFSPHCAWGEYQRIYLSLNTSLMTHKSAE